MVIIDLLLGDIFDNLLLKARGGDNARNNYICNNIDEDVLVFGSSRAFHHYNSQILSDSLGLSCYNCGQDGNGIILNYGRLMMIKEKHIPKIIIYDVLPSADLYSGEDNRKYLGWLKAYHERKGIKQIFNDVDPIENIKLYSSMYKYNSKFLQIISDVIHPMQNEDIQGYRPIHALFDPLKVNAKPPIIDTTIDSLKLSFLNSFMTTAQGSFLIFVVSPIWYGMDTCQISPIKEMCKRNRIPLLNFSNSEKYVHNDRFFKDGKHLNSLGADEFTRDLCIAIKSLDCMN